MNTVLYILACVVNEEERHDHGIKYDSYFMVDIGAPRSVSPDGCNRQAKVSWIRYEPTNTVLYRTHGVISPRVK